MKITSSAGNGENFATAIFFVALESVHRSGKVPGSGWAGSKILLP